ncbi:MAG: hypothetical protein JSV43_03505 [Methanobacteriota archaeon]|nr:MAG: hypothetical protein JSV43_03505 [Euryarchaeota archaeon]
MEEEKKSGTRKFAILAIVIVIIVVCSVALWEFVLRDFFKDGEGTEYEIDMWQGSERISGVKMSELEALPTVRYLDVFSQNESEVHDEGPLVKDVILLRIDESSLTNETSIYIKSDLNWDERTISWGEISNTSKSYILDFTKRGTTKFTSPDTQKNDRVRDVTEIRIGV